MRTRALLLAAALLGSAAPVAPQVIPVGPRTQVRSVAFELDEDVVAASTIEDNIAIRGRGSATGLRSALRWLPFVPPVRDRYFDPVELQRDRERIRRLLGRLGYPRAEVEYEVAWEEERDLVDVLFRIEVGPPLLVREVKVTWGEGPPTGETPADALGDIDADVRIRVGEPLDLSTLQPATASLAQWLGDRGYAFATVRPRIDVDSVAWNAAVELAAELGPSTRIGEISVEGNEVLDAETLRTFSRVRSGDPFTLARLRRAGRRIGSLDIVRSAAFEIRPDQPVDTLVDVVLRVREQDPRVVSGEVGYATDGGISGTLSWTHRNLFRGSRSVTAVLSGQSGIFAIGDTPGEFVRTTVAFSQPLFGRPHLSLNIAPFVEFRDDFRDRSLQAGGQATLLYQFGPLSSVALTWALSTRRIYEYRFGDLSGGIDYLDLLGLDADGVLDELGARLNSSVISLTASLGDLDLPSDPSRGFLVEPSLSFATPGRLSSVEYLKANVRASGYLPLGAGFTLAGRAGAGRIFPLGKSVPDSIGEGLTKYLQLRDVVFTAGGIQDVRGWTERQLGPRFPRVILRQGPDESAELVADEYSPLGGLNRVHATAELRFPLPLLGGALAGHAFLDAGRVWTTDDRFTSTDDPNGFEGLFWGTGAGLDYATPIGSIRLALGYKLNPSLLDLAAPGVLLDALLRDIPLSEVPRNPWRRFQIHIGIGRRL